MPFGWVLRDAKLGWEYYGQFRYTSPMPFGWVGLRPPWLFKSRKIKLSKPG